MLTGASQSDEAIIFNLPNETLDSILAFAFTPTKGRRRDEAPTKSNLATMCATSKVSKLFYALTIRHLYRSVPFEPRRSATKLTKASLYRFNRSLRQNHKLAPLCQHVQLFLHDCEHRSVSKIDEKLFLIAQSILKDLPNLKSFCLKVRDIECLRPPSAELACLKSNASKALKYVILS
jgi:hypothetical protein